MDANSSERPTPTPYRPILRSKTPAPLLSPTQPRTQTRVETALTATATQSQYQPKVNLSISQTETSILTLKHASPTKHHPLTITLPTPSSFPLFPYAPPYPIQTALMRAVYAAVEDANVRVAIVESPTGTGKTLSLLCSTLTWLADDKERRVKGELDGLREEMESGGDPPWVLAQSLNRHRRTLLAADEELEWRMEDARRREDEMRREAVKRGVGRMSAGRVVKRQKLSNPSDPTNDDDNDDFSFLPDNSTRTGTSDDGRTGVEFGDVDDEGISPAVRALMKKLADSRTKGAQVEEVGCTKIYYASRTHSQLAQVRSELLKPPLPPTRAVALASRASLCINEALRARSTTAAELDEGCREMLGEKKAHRCPYLPLPPEEHKMLDLRDRILSAPKDIEDLVTIGKELNTCPYFGSRRAIPQAQLVTLPYGLLLQKTAREALGIDLKDHVVIIDEAHNLTDTLLATHTPSLTSLTLHAALTQLRTYLARFRTLLTPAHGLHLRRLVRFLGALESFVERWRVGGSEGSPTAVSASASEAVSSAYRAGFAVSLGSETKLGTRTGTEKVKGKAEKGKSSSPRQEIMHASNLMSHLGPQVDGVNLLEIETYLKQSNIARKISGYSDKVAQKVVEKYPHAPPPRRHTTPPLHAVENFILALTNGDADGRLTLTQSGDKGCESVVLKYQLLNPSHHFKEIVDAARCVVLAGGTMSPIGDFQVQLFPFLKEEELSVFTCGHVIPPQNLQSLVIGRGPRGGELVFKYDQRGNESMITELGQVLTNIVNLVPHGLVVFFPSYAFLNAVKAAFQKSGLLEKVNLKKKVFFEPESTSDVENVLRQYALAVASTPSTSSNRKGGALLFAVIGAKLSEGINFSDILARAVVIVGLPFPSLASLELKERMRYVTELEQKLEIPRLPGAKDAGAELYENLCMKSVNQSIGRAIRHQNDYASLILVDSRYASPRINAKLPKWIGQNMIVTKNFGHAVREVGQFFREKTS